MPNKAAKSSRRRLPPLPSYEQQLRTLIESSGKWFYWEWDEHYRFTVLAGALFERAGIDPEIYLGRTLWEQDAAPFPGGNGWDEFKAMLRRRLPFSDFLYYHVDPHGELRYVSGNGQPVFDADGRFRGYRGVSKDITERVAIERRRAVEHGVARVLADDADGIAEAGARVIESVCRALGWSGGLRWELDAATQTLHCAESWHDGGNAAAAVIARLRHSSPRMLASDALLRRACASGRPQWLDLRQQPHPFLDPGRDLRGALLAPIRAGDRTLGLLQLFAPTAYPPDAELLQGAAFVGSALGDFWQRKQAEEALLRFRAAIDTSGDPIYLVDRSTMRFVDVNETACRATGYAREELLRMSPQELQLVEREQLERAYDQTIAAGAAGTTTEVRARAKDGRLSFAELHRRAVHIGNRWIIVTVARDVTQRKRAEDATRRLGRMYAALSATGEAIIRASSPAQLYAEVCQAAMRGGEFVAAAAVLADAQTPGAVRVAAAAQRGPLQLRAERISVDAGRPEGQGLIGTAFRTRAPAVSSDFLRDPRLRAWHAQARADGIASGAAVPLLRQGMSIGVLVFYSAEKHAFDEEIVRLLERLAGNVVFALESFEREAERARTEEALRESEARFRSLAELGSDWYWETDAEARFTRFEGRLVSRHPEAFHGHRGRRVWELGFDTDDSWEAKRRVMEAREPFRDFVYYHTRADGTRRYFLASGEPHFDADGRFLGYRGVGRDITGQKRAEERIQYLATHDTLTGLPNRDLFGQLLQQAVAAAPAGQRLALLFVDIDRFKIINDSLGLEAGDALLRELAARLQQGGRAGDAVARIGGDEFVVLVRDVADREQAAAAARRILSAIIRPVELTGRECRVTASIGIALYPDDGGDERALLKSADTAMHYAKQEGKNNFQFHASGQRSHSLERLTLEASLRQALEHGELFLHYQPRRSLRTGAITGVEALLRWRSPELGMVSPAQMIPLAEETGLIVPIGRWVLRTACRQNVAWQRQGLAPIRMAVNLSSRQFTDACLVEDIRGALEESGMVPELLELELTESMVAHDSTRTAAIIAGIKNLGARLAIDDFGTGYSSLAQLKRIPADTLKVDRSFIRDIPSDAEDRAITEAIIAMGKTLNLTVVAEGVETQAQEQFLRARACDEIQGYYFSRPVPADAVPALLRAHPPALEN